MRVKTQREIIKIVESALRLGQMYPYMLKRINEIMMKDMHPEDEEATPLPPGANTTGFLDLLSTILMFSLNSKNEDRLFELNEAGIMDQLLSLPFVAEDMPRLATPWDRQAAETLVAQIQAMLYRHLDFWHDGELYHFALADFVKRLAGAVQRRRERLYAKAKRRCGVYKEELMAAAWHPRRVEAWLAAGLEVDTI